MARNRPRSSRTVRVELDDLHDLHDLHDFHGLWNKQRSTLSPPYKLYPTPDITAVVLPTTAIPICQSFQSTSEPSLTSLLSVIIHWHCRSSSRVELFTSITTVIRRGRANGLRVDLVEINANGSDPCNATGPKGFFETSTYSVRSSQAKSSRLHKFLFLRHSTWPPPLLDLGLADESTAHGTRQGSV